MRFVSAIATFAAGAALALVLAWWGWRIFGPAPVHIETPAPADPAAAILAADLFRSAGTAVAGAPAASMLPHDARLLGIIAQSAQQGYALFHLPSGPRLVAKGQEIVPGATLVSVDADAITIRDGAGERRLILRGPATAATSSSRPTTAAPASRSTATTPVSRSTTAAPASRSTATTPVSRSTAATPGASKPLLATSRKAATATCAPPAGFRGNVVRLNAELLGGLSADAGPWRTLLTAGDGGLVVRDSGGFSAMLGLKSGDRIKQANGIALRVPDDVTAAIIRPLIADQGVRIIGSRAGATQELWLANVACAG
jgi:hypothetical protein